MKSRWKFLIVTLSSVLAGVLIGCLLPTSMGVSIRSSANLEVPTDGDQISESPSERVERALPEQETYTLEELLEIGPEDRRPVDPPCDPILIRPISGGHIREVERSEEHWRAPLRLPDDKQDVEPTYAPPPNGQPARAAVWYPC